MAKRQREWAKRKRIEFIVRLGGRCVDCGVTDNLQLDVIIPVDNGRHHRALDSSGRMVFYRRQLEAGNLAVRCETCNGRKGLHERATV